MRHKAFFSALFALSCAKAPAGSHTAQIIGADDLEEIEAAKGTPQYDFARSVAKVDLGSGGCTGFRVAQDLFITNNHCFEAGGCDQTSFTLGVEKALPVEKQKKLICANVLAHDPDLDFALYQVTYGAGDQAGDDYPTVTLARSLPAEGTRLFVAGFPIGDDFKRMDRSVNCKLTAAADKTLPNAIDDSCDTDSGSSGSPIFAYDTGHVIALHWGHTDDPNANNATRMGLILGQIEQSAGDAYARLKIVD